MRMPGGRRRQPSAGGRPGAAGPALALLPRPCSSSPGEPAQMVQGGGRDSRRLRRAAASPRGRTPLSHLPDKHHENSAAHTVIAAPAAGRVSTSPFFPRGGERARSPLLPPPCALLSGRGARAAAPALTRPPAPTARRPGASVSALSSRLPAAPSAPAPGSGRPSPARRPRRRGGVRRGAGLPSGTRPARAASGRGRAGWGRAAVAAV